MRNSAFISCMLALSACGASQAGTAGSADELVAAMPANESIPGGRLQLWLPPGFVRAPRLPQWHHGQHDVVVTTGELSVPPERSEETIGGMLNSLRAQATEQLETEQEGDRLSFLGRSQTHELRGTVLSSGGAIGFVLVRSAAPNFSAEVEQIVRSAVLDSDRPLEPTRTLGFTMDVADGLEERPISNSMAMYWETGIQPPLPVGPANVSVMFLPVPDRPLTAGALGELVGSTLGNEHPVMEDAESGQTRAGNLVAYDLTTHGEKDGTELFIHVRAVIDTREDGSPYGIFILKAMVERAQTDWHPRLIEMLASFAPQ